MSVSLTCGVCASKLKAPERLIGKPVPCPKCKATVYVMAPEPPPIPQPPPVPVPPPIPAPTVAAVKTVAVRVRPPEPAPIVVAPVRIEMPEVLDPRPARRPRRLPPGTYLDDGYSRITSDWVKIGNTSIPVRSISSVRSIYDPPDHSAGVRYVVLAAVCAGACAMANMAAAAVVLGLVFGLPGLIYLLMAKGRYVLLVGASGGDRKALVSRDAREVSDVAEAVERAVEGYGRG